MLLRNTAQFMEVLSRSICRTARKRKEQRASLRKAKILIAKGKPELVPKSLIVLFLVILHNNPSQK